MKIKIYLIIVLNILVVIKIHAQTFADDQFKMKFNDCNFILNFEEGVKTYKCKKGNFIYRINIYYQGSISSNKNFQDSYFQQARNFCNKSGIKYMEYIFRGVRAIEYSQYVANGAIIRNVLFISNERIYTLMQTGVSQNEIQWNYFKNAFSFIN